MTNEEIGKKLGLTHSAVSRIRRGERLPSLEVMMAIDVNFGWPMPDQVMTRVHHGAKVYSSKLEQYIQEVIDGE